MNTIRKINRALGRQNLTPRILRRKYISSRINRQLGRMTKILSRKGLYEFLSQEYSHILPKSEVLTVGAGGKVNELLDRYSREIGFNVLSFDIDENRGPDIVGDICSFDFDERKFEVIVMSEVLEHVHSPHLALDNVYKILDDGGKLILTTPFIMPIHDKPCDYYRYTRYGLEFLLKEFKDVQVRERNSYFEAIDVLWVRLWQTGVRNAHRAAHFFIPLVFIKMPITILLSKLINTNAMTSGYVVTAKKPQANV